MSDQLENEDVYSATRAEQLLFQLERSHGYSRQELLKLGALAVPLLAGFAQLASSPTAGARSDNGSPISKPLPPAWFTNFSSNAESAQGLRCRAEIRDRGRWLLRRRPLQGP